MDNLRIQRQNEIADIYLNSDKYGILFVAPRMGKCFISITILEKLNPISILIAYPDNKIKQSWLTDFIKRDYKNENITFTTHLSLHKYKEMEFDVVILDEIQILSKNQIEVCKELFQKNRQVLGLSGTLSKDTQESLLNELKLPIIATYSIEQAIKEKVITDYEISIIKVPLDNLKLNKHKDKFKTEKQVFEGFTWIIEKLEKLEKNTMFLRLARMRVIQNSIAKLEKTKEIIRNNKDKRLLIFCGNTKIADSLGIPSFHSKSKDKKVFDDFVNGKGNHLAVCKIGASGITFTPLSMVVMNYFSSNEEDFIQKLFRALSFEYDNLDKIAKITIITSSESVEIKWLHKAIKSLNKEKITWT